ncbi:bifunctional (p)ppGpp synthase/hydrolase SpoT [Bacteroidales bacterium]|nr:bifunctional (p)ppGpp synthase/hydrolase SpoT [Bacteroidales bacterium]
MENLFSPKDKKEFIKKYGLLVRSLGDSLLPEDVSKLKKVVEKTAIAGHYKADIYGLNILLRSIETSLIVSEEINLKRASVLGIFLVQAVSKEVVSLKEVGANFGTDVSGIIAGLMKAQELYAKNAAIESENFRNLLISFTEDVRVILIMIADRLYLMRSAKRIKNEEQGLMIAAEASYLYAPLAHRLGLYKIKSELEDLSLKLQDREMYDFIAHKLNETKSSRDKYISEFIAPIEKRLNSLGLNFDIKGRIKSIHSIRNKLLKQKIDFESIYDLFAIRLVADTDIAREKAECWQIYSVIADMYQPNPKRLKDWLSIPKSNGYESLHTTVMGQEGRWVEVQIRSRRMDAIAEKGLAAHWKYKGLKGESGLDEWLNSVREVLENKESSPNDLMQDFKMDLYDDEIFVFTPAGDLFKLPRNATVLDFAFAIHTSLGSRCVSAQIKGKNVSIKHRLQNGDQVHIITSPNQAPKQDWLSFTLTSKARIKIKQSLKEAAAKQVEFAKELLSRRFKNRKIEEDEAVLMRLIKKKGYKTVTNFYADIANESLDVNAFMDQYAEQLKKGSDNAEHHPDNRSVEGFLGISPNEEISKQEDVLLIDKNLTGIEYKLAKCCKPIYGDDIFGFVSSQGFKIHRLNCPNASQMFSRYGYRIVKARWSGKSEGQYAVSIKVIGRDDISIVTNISSVISRESSMTLRSFNVDSVDGLFQGNITVILSNTSALDLLIKKIKAVKGIKQVERIN